MNMEKALRVKLIINYPTSNERYVVLLNWMFLNQISNVYALNWPHVPQNNIEVKCISSYSIACIIHKLQLIQIWKAKLSGGSLIILCRDTDNTTFYTGKPLSA